jgi:hypothetical protein
MRVMKQLERHFQEALAQLFRAFDMSHPEFRMAHISRELYSQEYNPSPTAWKTVQCFPYLQTPFGYPVGS